MPDKILLSICIPTYNRASTIQEALESIMEQVDKTNKDLIEICIADNASTDNSFEVIDRYRENSPVKFTYHKNPVNKWADYNFLKVIEISNGKFCWYLWSDDILEAWSINKVLQTLQGNPDISWCIGGRKMYSVDFQNPVKNSNPVARWKYPADGKINSMEEFSDFFLYCWFLWAQIFRKDLWNEIYESQKLEQWHNSYIHLYMFSHIFTRSSNLIWISQELTWCRMWNDSFTVDRQEWLIKRMYIDVLWYRDIAHSAFEKKYVDKILWDLSSTLIRGHIIQIKNSSLPLKKKYSVYSDLIKRYYKYSAFWKKSFLFMCMPKILTIGLRNLWRIYAKSK